MLARAALLLLLMTTQANAIDLNKIRKNWHPALPNPAQLASLSMRQTYVVGLPWCWATATMLASVTLRRELTLREAHMIFASCVLPIIGGYLVGLAFDRHPEWERLPLPLPWGYDAGIGRQS